MVRDLTAPVDAMKGSGRILRIKAQMLLCRSATEGEARRVLKNPNRFPVCAFRSE